MTEPRLRLRLFLAGNSLRSTSAHRAIVSLLAEFMDPEDVDLDVVDVFENPELAEQDRILATPTLLRLYPAPTRRVIGDLGDAQSVTEALDLARLMTKPSEDVS